MINVKVENKKSQTALKPEKDTPIEQEIVLLITSSLLAFRDKMKNLGYKEDVIDKDCRLMLKQAKELYTMKTNEVPKNVGPVTKPYDPMQDIMKQVDQMLNIKEP